MACRSWTNTTAQSASPEPRGTGAHNTDPNVRRTHIRTDHDRCVEPCQKITSANTIRNPTCEFKLTTGRTIHSAMQVIAPCTDACRLDGNFGNYRRGTPSRPHTASRQGKSRRHIHCTTLYPEKPDRPSAESIISTIKSASAGKFSASREILKPLSKN